MACSIFKWTEPRAGMNHGLDNQSDNNVVSAVRIIVNNDRQLTFDKIVVLLSPEIETSRT